MVARAAIVPTLDSNESYCSMDLVKSFLAPPVPKRFLYALLRYS